MTYFLNALVVLLAVLLVVALIATRDEISRLEKLNVELALEAGYESPEEEWRRSELLRLRAQHPSYGNRRLRREFNRLHREESGVEISQRLTDFFLDPETRH